MRLTFRQRIFAWLVVVAVFPAVLAVGAALASLRLAGPATQEVAWERAAQTWRTAQAPVDTAQAQAALEAHGAELTRSVALARRARLLNAKISQAVAAAVIALGVLVALGAVRLAGHLSRQLSRPIDELMEWTARLARGEPLPSGPPSRGAPEFATLRDAFRRAAAELDAARSRDLEAAQLRTFRDLAQQVAHELKNPLTPLRLALARLRQLATGDQQEVLGVVEAETGRIEQIAREFAEFGRLPEGPPAPVDMGELLEELVRSTVPARIPARLTRSDGVPMVPGHYDALRRAFQNLILNACDACSAGEAAGAAGGAGGAGGAAGRAGAITVELLRQAGATDGEGGAPAVVVRVSDTGVGIPPEALERIFDPYFTTKPSGTGLGLPLVRQTIRDHGGLLAVESTVGSGTTFTVTLPLELKGAP